MEFNKFQKGAIKDTFYNGEPDMPAIVYSAIAIAEEGGEFAGKVKKLFRDKGGIIDFDQQKKMANELGDILYYIATAADSIGITLNDVADANIDKRKRRIKNGTEHGDGDNR